MSTIGLYDIDLWHGIHSVPNLELMKTYNYFLKKNQNVIFMKPETKETRFNSITYFKDNPKVILPKALNVFGERKNIYGYGFFKIIEELKPEIKDVPPIYLPYDSWVNKLSIKSLYESLRQNSYIRFETKDFSDYKTHCKIIYLADHDALQLEDISDFFLEYKNKNFYFFNNIKVNNKEDLEKFIRYEDLFNRQIIIDFPFTEELFYEYYKYKVWFPETKKEKETELNYLMRITKMILWYKSKGLSYYSKRWENNFAGYIKKWGFSKNSLSFKEFYNNCPTPTKLMNEAPSQLRLLLKQNPQFIKKSSLDLKNNL